MRQHYDDLLQDTGNRRDLGRHSYRERAHTRQLVPPAECRDWSCISRTVIRRGAREISGTDFEAQIPYEVAVGVTFDQQQVDIP
jgi:hypothetical protein